jgi:hypothetical protein
MARNRSRIGKRGRKLDAVVNDMNLLATIVLFMGVGAASLLAGLSMLLFRLAGG